MTINAQHAIAAALLAYIVAAILLATVIVVRRRWLEWQARHRCRYCGSPVVVRGQVRACLNSVCGAQWRI